MMDADFLLFVIALIILSAINICGIYYLIKSNGEWYRRDRELGSGCFGTVYSCTNKSTGERFATKVIKERCRKKKVIKDCKEESDSIIQSKESDQKSVQKVSKKRRSSKKNKKRRLPKENEIQRLSKVDDDQRLTKKENNQRLSNMDDDQRFSKESDQGLLQESDRMKNLNHPNIIKFYGAEIIKKEIHFRMEYSELGSLKSIYEASGAFDNATAWKYTRDILNGLHYLHHLKPKPLLHCDVKCANVLLTSVSGEAKLSDFGIANVLYHNQDYLLAGKGYGVFRFRAPEIDVDGNYTEAADVWSVGVTVLEMKIAGYPDKIQKFLNPLIAYREHKQVDGSVLEFIDLCLKLNPKERAEIPILQQKSFADD